MQHRKIPTESDIEIATRSLDRVELDIERKKKDIEREEMKEMENKAVGYLRVFVVIGWLILIPNFISEWQLCFVALQSDLLIQR